MDPFICIHAFFFQNSRQPDPKGNRGNFRGNVGETFENSGKHAQNRGKRANFTISRKKLGRFTHSRNQKVDLSFTQIFLNLRINANP